MTDSLDSLRHLGKNAGEIQYTDPDMEMLDTFPNPNPDRKYTISFITSEFTSLCPVTGQPDFADIRIEYIPRELCVESKSLKLYLLAYRQSRSFVEALTNKILDDLVKVMNPVWIAVTTDFVARGGIGMQVVAEHPENAGGEK